MIFKKNMYKTENWRWILFWKVGFHKDHALFYHQSASTCVCYKNKSKKLKVHKWYLLKVENWFNCYFEKYWVFTN